MKNKILCNKNSRSIGFCAEWFDKQLSTLALNFQQYIYNQQRLWDHGILIPHLHKALLVSGNFMKHLSVIILLLFTGCKNKHHLVAERYSDGSKKIEFIYLNRNDVVRNKLINGIELAYDSLGNLVRRDEYRSGKLNGVEILYYPNGKIKGLTTVRNGSAYGFEYLFDEMVIQPQQMYIMDSPSKEFFTRSG